MIFMLIHPCGQLGILWMLTKSQLALDGMLFYHILNRNYKPALRDIL
jgi:hypothetical protein